MGHLGLNWDEDVDPSSLSEHERFIRSVDWASSSIGPPSTWPAQLHQSIDFMLADPTPAALMWGEDLTMIYNKGFEIFAGTKHPKLMGTSPAISYEEVWDPLFIDIIERGRTTGKATRHEDQQLFLHRHGYLEECYVTYTFVPLLDESKHVVGFYHTALETTNHVLAARRTQTLLAIGDAITASRSLSEYWISLLGALEVNNQDLPWVLAYSLSDPDGHGSMSDSESGTSPSNIRASSSCTLAGVAGKASGQIPLKFDRKDDQDPFVQLIKRSIRSGETSVLRDTDVNLPAWVFDVGFEFVLDRSHTALLIPIRLTSRNDAEGQNVIGFLVAGISPRCDYNIEYERFAQLLGRQLATSAASILLLEQEVRRQEQLAEQLAVNARHTSILEQKLNKFSEISNIGMWVSSAKGELLYANKAWFDQADLESNTPNLSVTKWMPLITESSLDTFQRHWAQLMNGKQPVTFEIQFKSRWKHRDADTGEVLEGHRWFLISAFPEFGEDGNLTKAWGCNVDVSYQKWAENLKAERLVETIESKRQSENFIDMTSHEMRNPLSAILQCSDNIATIVEEAKSNTQGSTLELDLASVDAIADSAATVLICANHQKRILDDILTMSKLDASLLVVAPCEVDPIATVQHALALHQQEFKGAGVEGFVQIHSSYYDLNVARVFLDPSRLLQILINLLTNAIKFTQYQEQRRVTLHLAASTNSPGESDECGEYFAPRANPQKPPTHDADWGSEQVLYLQFAVEDSGCGLSELELQRLFRRFAQANIKTHVKVSSGSGLGLFICKELTELQGGRIGVSSKPGVGSTFRFYLKARRAVPLSQNGGSQAMLAVQTLKDPTYTNSLNRTHSARSNPIIGSPTDANALHILIVEDNLINQKVMATQLKKAGCIVHVANHGADALVFLMKTTFAKDSGPSATPLSIVLMDLEMPVMDGLTCVTKIREMQESGELTRPVPVIAVTANARIDQVKQAKDQGMDDVVTKPFRIKDLMPQMWNLLEKVSV
ncbi:hypothetical protein EJ08DRAFT_595273 [Tothia fuscella]|uniref:Histidine kinase n=1 Tax=Tothia fuscella TaxID=1048955 RepID=A0A9P4TVF5_9PEZI|nr:hypothetical protein EJ08DRAFT_595273 [Tothia fuscella]